MLVELRGKHDTVYYLAASQEQLLRTFVEIVRVRVEDEEYITKPAAKPYGLKEGELTADEVSKLPAAYQEQARQIFNHNENARREHAEELTIWAQVQAALAGDGAAAFQVLKAREDYEYERFRLVEPMVVDVNAPLKKPPRRRRKRSSTGESA